MHASTGPEMRIVFTIQTICSCFTSFKTRALLTLAVWHPLCVQASLYVGPLSKCCLLQTSMCQPGQHRPQVTSEPYNATSSWRYEIPKLTLLPALSLQLTLTSFCYCLSCSAALLPRCHHHQIPQRNMCKMIIPWLPYASHKPVNSSFDILDYSSFLMPVCRSRCVSPLPLHYLV